MRTWLSLLVIAFSIVAIGGGYLSGSSAMAPASALAHVVPPVDFRSPAPAVFARSLHGAHSLDDANDPTAPFEEDAVVSRTSRTGRLAEDATVALVIEHAGPSLRLESGFLDFPVPLTLAIDPAADEAKAVAAAAVDRGKVVYVELTLTPGIDARALKVRIDKLRIAIPSMSGLAVRFSEESQEHEAGVLAQALRDEHLPVLDLTGIEKTAEQKLQSGNVVSRRRDVTIDNRDEPAYVSFMLAQAVQVARGRGTAVIVAHPYPGSLGALSTLVTNSERDGVNFTRL